jgi:acyl carrier protein
MVKMSDVETQVLEFIREERPDLTITAETELMEAGVLDSIALVKSIQFLEGTFGISIPDSDIDPTVFATPRAIADYVSKRRGDTPAAASPAQAVPAE